LSKQKHSKRYAKMFLNAVGVDKAPDALKELSILKALMEQSREFRNFLVSPMFSEDERGKAFEEVGRTLDLSSETVKFINYLAGKNATSALGEVTDKAVALYADMKNLAKATVITPVAIGTEYEGRLKESLKRLVNREVELEYVTDPSLLGGMLVKVGSTMYDGSVSGQLRLMKDELIKG
jgi:F-type H+-transporting ATPase subunit delta